MSKSGHEDPAATPWRFRPDASLLVSLIIYLAAAGAMWASIHARTGAISYTLDDAYIHAAMAKNMAASGTFGFVPGEFAAGSSSPAWTLLLSLAFVLTGPQSWMSALLATVFGGLCVERAHACLKTAGVGPIARAIVVILAMLYAPILPILSTGMEHTLHLWAMLGLFNVLLAAGPHTTRQTVALFMWAMLAAGSRYESLFALPPLLLWLAWKGHWRPAFALAGGMALPVIAFAAWSMSHGGYALPNSLMLKGNVDHAAEFHAFSRLTEHDAEHPEGDNLHLLVTMILLVAAAFATAPWKKDRPAGPIWFPVTVGVMLLTHLQLAGLGWFWRYEGYLVVLGLVAAATLLVPLGRFFKGRPGSDMPALAAYVLLFSCTLPLLQRAMYASGQIVTAAGNINDQQIQMARVGRLLGPGARIAVNDLGAMAFFTDAHILDLFGLGDNETARAKHEQRFTSEYLRNRIREDKVDYIIYFPSWFSPEYMPDELIPVEEWLLDRNVICGSARVVFSATSPEAAVKLRAALERYRADFPADPRSTNQMNPIAAR